MNNIPNFSITREQLIQGSPRTWLIRIKFFLPCLTETLYTTTGFEYILKSSFLNNRPAQETEIILDRQDVEREFDYLYEQLKTLEEKYKNACFVMVKHDNSSKKFTFLSINNNLKLGDRVLVDTINGAAEGVVSSFIGASAKTSFFINPTRRIITKLKGSEGMKINMDTTRYEELESYLLNLFHQMNIELSDSPQVFEDYLYLEFDVNGQEKKFRYYYPAGQSAYLTKTNKDIAFDVLKYILSYLVF